MKYRKKPVIVEAVRYLGRSSDILDFLKESECPSVLFKPADLGEDRKLVIRTLEGNMTANYGDWIIRGVKGELYPCKPDIFEATYEVVP